MATKTPGQRTRLLILVLYLVTLFCASKLALDSWIPPTSEKGLWFYSGLAALLLGNLLVTPFYHKPADAISYGVSAIVGMLAVNVWSRPQRSGFDEFLWSCAVGFLTTILIASLACISLKDSSSGRSKKLSKSLALLTDTVGGPRIVFSVVFLFALVTFHRDVPREYLVIGLAWAMTVALRPLEGLATLFLRLFDLWREGIRGKDFGKVVGHQTPRIVLLQRDCETATRLGDTLVVRREDGVVGLAMILDAVGFTEEPWVRAIHLSLSSDVRRLIDAVAASANKSVGSAVQVDPKTLDDYQINDRVWSQRDHLIGLVTSDTDISRLRVELIRCDLDLEEGRLVEVMVGDKPVLYQIINGLTKEEIVQQKNTRGYVRADAKKIGCWNVAKRRFEVVKWIPQPNEPVFLVDAAEPVASPDSVGHFPGTDYPVSVDVHSLVTHNTAILGILGAGKSFLAIELVERMIEAGIKVVCLDLTNQYAQELSRYYDSEGTRPTIEKLQTIGSAGKTVMNRNVEEGGSVAKFGEGIRSVLERFLRENEERRLLVFNPLAFEVWRQDSKLYKDEASMATLTPTEIARIFAEAALEVLQAQGMTDQARCCLVFEEAHSLIPEWNAAASGGDQAATNGTAKAILQGRKYGLGCLVITQRTANVTKSILNQCNTVFALRVFDATGMEFLRNYVGDDYAGVLSTLEDRHAVVFGRASSCRNPVLIRLNDREDFLRLFRTDSANKAETA